MSTVPLHDAAKRLREGGVAAFPTETVYGLGANAYDGRAVAEVYALKGRPQFNPLIIHFADAAAAAREVEWDARAQLLAERFWPGPLTLVLKRRADSRVSLLACAGLDTLAVRVPGHEVARELIALAGIPLAAPSANKSGRVSPTTASHVEAEFGGAMPVVEGGACEVGLESSVVSLCGAPTILRPGAVTKEMLEAALGGKVELAGEGAAVSAPGMLASHYAPSIPVRLNAREARAGEALLGFGFAPGAALNLSEAGDLKEAAANLFAFLRALDRPEFTGIAVMPVPAEGLGAAINDRLARAAS